MKEKLVELKRKAIDKAYKTGWFGQRPVRNVEENQFTDVSQLIKYRQQALDWVDRVEGLGFYCEAMREHIDGLDNSEFVPLDPDELANHRLEPLSPGDSFSPELIIEGLPEQVIPPSTWERDWKEGEEIEFGT